MDVGNNWLFMPPILTIDKVVLIRLPTTAGGGNAKNIEVC